MPMMVFICHPMTGDIEGNTKKVVEICRSIHSKDIIPVFPSFTTRRYLTPDPADRELARIMIEEYFRRRVIDEVWIFGDRLTAGIKREIRLAIKYGIPVVAKTRETEIALSEFLQSLDV